MEIAAPAQGDERSRTEVHALTALETTPCRHVLWLADAQQDALLRMRLASAASTLELSRVDDPTSASAALVAQEWDAVFIAYPSSETARVLLEAPVSPPRVLVTEAHTPEAQLAALRLGALYCSLEAGALPLRTALEQLGAAGRARRRRESRQRFEVEQIHILERIAAGDELRSVLDRVARLIEAEGDGACSILLLDHVTGCVHHGAAPSLPPALVAALDGSAIGPYAGSCGAAAHSGKPVFVRDIATHPNWDSYRALALPLGLRACWSTPILSPKREVLGTFAVYYREARDPRPDELRAVASATHLASVAIMAQRHREALQASEARYALLLETTHEGVLTLDLDERVTFCNARAATMLGDARDGLLGRPFSELVHPTERATLSSALGRRKSGISEQYELRMQTHEGGDVYVIVSASPISDGSGQVVGMLKLLTDITERRLAEQALQRSELELRSIFESAGVGITLFDDRVYPIRFNSALVQILGYAAAELQRRSLLDLVHPDDRPLVREQRLLLQRGEGTRAQLELRMLRQDGQLVWVRVHSSRFKHASPSEPRGVLVIEDITESRRVEQALQAEQRMLEVMYQNVSEIITYLSVEPGPTLRFVSVNRAFCEVLGVERQDVIGRRVEEVMTMAPTEAVAARYRQAIEERRTVLWEEVGQFPSGPVYGEVSATPVIDESGVCTHLIVTSRIVTERKLAEAKLAEQAALLDRARDAIVKCDLQYVVQYWNAAAERLYGYRRDEAMGRSMLTLLALDQRILERAHTELLEHGAWSGELIVQTKDGREVTVDSSCTLLRDAGGMPESVLAINTDATEKKSLEAQVQLAQRMESLGTLAGGIAHDFNNILAAMRGFLEFAIRSLPAEATALRSLEIVHGATDRAVDLVQRILTFSRRTAVQREVCVLSRVLEEVLRLLRATLPRMIRIDASYAPGELPVRADATQIHQIVMNLMTNAVHALDSHGTIVVSLAPVILHARMTGVATEVPAGSYMRLTVADDGSGMEPETLGRIFDPFFTTKGPGAGTGLGLSVVLGIVKEHEGALQVSSAKGQGTQFDIYLPAGARVTEDRSVDVRHEALQGHGARILCVDDEELLLELEQTFLEELGYQVDRYSSPVAALQALSARPADYAALVTDHGMGELSGIELAAAAHELRPDLPIILSTGYLARELREQAQAAGVSGFVSKPDFLEPLARELARLLAAAHSSPSP